MKITTVGIDLAKNVFSLHGIDDHGKAVLKRTVNRVRVTFLRESAPVRNNERHEMSVQNNQAASS